MASTDTPAQQVQAAAAALVREGNPQPLLELTETFEIDPPANTASVTAEQWQTLQILACIHADDLVNAKFIGQRLDTKSLDKNKALAAADNAARLLWSKEHSEAMKTLTECSWTGALQPVVDATIHAVRTRELALMASTYTHVNIAKVAERLGLPEGDTLQLCQAQGWQADARSGMLRAPTATADAAAGDLSEPQALHAATQALRGLLDTAVALEETGDEEGGK